MNALSGQTLLYLWEVGQGRHPIDQALAILGVAFPGTSPDKLAALSIGQRDARLLLLYTRFFEPKLTGLAYCPQCQTALEFLLPVADLGLTLETAQAGQLYQLTEHDYQVRFRLPNSFDLAAIAHYSQPVDLEAARNVLVERCILEATYQAKPVMVVDLPDTVVAALAAAMAEHDPQAEIELDLNCPQCGHTWAILLDIVTFMWAKISSQARRLLGEVHLLARAYGWPEADILAMSALRRLLYLEMVT